MSVTHARRFLKEIIENEELRKLFNKCETEEDLKNFMAQYEYSFSSSELFYAYNNLLYCCLNKSDKILIDESYQKFRSLIKSNIKEIFTVE